MSAITMFAISMFAISMFAISMFAISIAVYINSALFGRAAGRELYDRLT